MLFRSEASSPSRFLHRSDNDLVYKEGWDDMALRAFRAFPKMGQLGLVNELFQLPPSQHAKYEKFKVTKKGLTLYKPMNDHKNVGGPCMVRKELFDKGLRWKEDKWDTNVNEDAWIAQYVNHLGYEIYEFPIGVIDHVGYGDMFKYFGYYNEAYKKRNLGNWFLYRLELEKSGKIRDGYTID